MNVFFSFFWCCVCVCVCVTIIFISLFFDHFLFKNIFFLCFWFHCLSLNDNYDDFCKVTIREQLPLNGNEGNHSVANAFVFFYCPSACKNGIITIIIMMMRRVSVNIHYGFETLIWTKMNMRNAMKSRKYFLVFLFF